MCEGGEGGEVLVHTVTDNLVLSYLEFGTLSYGRA